MDKPYTSSSEAWAALLAAAGSGGALWALDYFSIQIPWLIAFFVAIVSIGLLLIASFLWWRILFSKEELSIIGGQMGIIEHSSMPIFADGLHLRVPFPVIIVPIHVKNDSFEPKTIYPLLTIEGLGRWFEALRSDEKTSQATQLMNDIILIEDFIYPPLTIKPKLTIEGRFIFMMDSDAYDNIFPPEGSEHSDTAALTLKLSFHDFFTNKQISESISLTKYD